MIALAASSRGFTGQISHIWSSLTSTTTAVGDTPSRLAELSSSRPDYWHEAISVGNHHLLAGAGAGGYTVAHWRYQTPRARDSRPRPQLHLPDLCGLRADRNRPQSRLADRVVAVGRSDARGRGGPSGPLRDLRREAGGRMSSETAEGEPTDGQSQLATDHEAERDAVWALLGVVAAFAVSSAIDWTWFAPGVALPALAAAGWIAGRGPPVTARRDDDWTRTGLEHAAGSDPRDHRGGHPGDRGGVGSLAAAALTERHRRGLGRPGQGGHGRGAERLP